MRVYQKSLSFAEEILQLTRNPPNGPPASFDQLRRASMSIPSNIAEGSGVALKRPQTILLDGEGLCK